MLDLIGIGIGIGNVFADSLLRCPEVEPAEVAARAPATS